METRNKSFKQEGSAVNSPQETGESRNFELIVGTLNVGTLTNKTNAVAEMMAQRTVGILCAQETKLKGSGS